MKNCLMCGESFSGKRKDSVFCSNSCKAKHWEQKKNGKVNPLEGIKVESSFNKQKEKILPVPRSVDAQDLEPFLNLITDDATNGNASDFSNTQLLLNKTEKKEIKEPEIILPEKFVLKIVKENNLQCIVQKEKLEQCRKDIVTCENEIKKLQDQIEAEKNRNGNGIYVASAGSGALIGYKLGEPTEKKAQKKSPQKNDNRILYTFLGGLFGMGLGRIIDSATEDGREQAKKEKIQQYQKLIAELQSYLPNLKQQEKQLMMQNFGLPQYINKEQKVLNPAYTQALILKEQQRKRLEKNIIDRSLAVQESLSGLNEVKNPASPLNILKLPNNLETDKISSMQNVANLKFRLLNFTGKWFEFFGQPQTNFFCVIHGMSGEGKTNFSIQFAKYLAENFGNVLYISGEEGFAPTFQKKIKTLGANIPHLYAADIRTGQELLTDIPNKYHFIIIDSLNNMGIDPEVMRAIRNKFKQSGIIAICQSTKDGKMRGSYEIVHDSDIAVKVVNGIAITSKNRFKEKNMEFDVFAAYRKNGENKSGLKLLNNRSADSDRLMDDFKNTI